MNEPLEDLRALDLEEELDPIELLLAGCLELPEEKRSEAFARILRENPEHAVGLRARLEALRAIGIETVPGEEPHGFPEQLGDFRLLSRIGGGGMGVVYLAVQTSLQRDVALKLVRPEHLFFEGSRARFRREAQAAARLQHPGIVPIYTVGEDGGIPWFAMEHVKGCTLAEALSGLRGRASDSLSGSELHAVVVRAAGARADPAGPPPEGSFYAGSWVAACLGIALQVAEALEHAHQRFILHRDVKPSNIMLTPDGRSMLLDFGLTSSGRSEHVTKTGSQLGTLHYMSPEQVRSARDVDARTDVYSLGATLYEMLTLQLPYCGKDELETGRLIAEGNPPSIRVRNRRVDEDVETVCLKAMDRDRERRYPSCAALARDLANLLFHRPIEARPPGLLLRARRLAQRRPALATALILGSLLIAGTPSALLLQERSFSASLQQSLGRESQAKLDLARALASEKEAGRQIQRQLEIQESQNRVAIATMDTFVGLFLEASAASARGEVIEVHSLLDQGLERVNRDYAQDPLARGRTLHLLGESQRELRNYQKAVELFEEASAALAQSDQTGASQLRGEVEAALADQLVQLGLYERAQEHVQTAHELLSPFQQGSPDRLDKLDMTRASILHHQGQPDAALLLRRQILERFRSRRSSSEKDVAAAMAQLATSLLHRAEYEEAAELLEPVAEIFERCHGPVYPELVTVLANLGFAKKSLGALDEAGEIYGRALLLADRIWPQPGVLHAGILVNRAGLQQARGQHEQALEGYRRAAGLYENLLPENHPNRVKTLANLAGCLIDSGRCSEAEALYGRLIELQSEVLGEQDLSVAISHRNVAICALKRGAIDEAGSHLRTAMKILEGNNGQASLRAEVERMLAQLDGG